MSDNELKPQAATDQPKPARAPRTAKPKPPAIAPAAPTAGGDVMSRLDGLNKAQLTTIAREMNLVVGSRPTIKSLKIAIGQEGSRLAHQAAKTASAAGARFMWGGGTDMSRADSAIRSKVAESRARFNAALAQQIDKVRVAAPNPAPPKGGPRGFANEAVQAAAQAGRAKATAPAEAAPRLVQALVMMFRRDGHGVLTTGNGVQHPFSAPGAFYRPGQIVTAEIDAAGKAIVTPHAKPSQAARADAAKPADTPAAKPSRKTPGKGRDMAPANAGVVKSYTDRLFAAGTDRAQFDRVYGELRADKSVKSGEMAEIARQFRNQPSGGTHQFRFPTKGRAADFVFETYMVRAEAESRLSIIENMTRWAADPAPASKPASPAPEPTAKPLVPPSTTPPDNQSQMRQIEARQREERMRPTRFGIRNYAPPASAPPAPPSSAPQASATPPKKPGAGTKALGLLAPAAIGIAMMAAANDAKAAGADATGEAKAAGAAGAEAAGTMALFAGGTAVAVGGLMRAGMTAARAIPAVQAAMMVGNAGYEAVAAASRGEGAGGIAQAAVKGAWDASLPGAIVNTAVQASQVATDRAALASPATAYLNAAAQKSAEAAPATAPQPAAAPAQSGSGDIWVPEHTRADGTKVEGHYRKRS